MYSKNKIPSGKLIQLFSIAILALMLSSTLVWADGNEELAVTLPVFTGKYDVGVVSLGSFGLMGEATTLMKIPEDAEIVAGYIYLSGCSNLTPAQLTEIQAQISNSNGQEITVTASVIGLSEDCAQQCFTYRADVTEVIHLGEAGYNVKITKLPGLPTSGRLYGGGLLVIYSQPNLPEANIWIADGLDYFDAVASFPTSKTVSFPPDGNQFERYGSVKIFAGVDDKNRASGIWYKIGQNTEQNNDIMDTPGAVDYNNSSNSDPNIDTDPLSAGLGIRRGWSMVEFMIPVKSEQNWVSFQLESQTDHAGKQPFSGVWNMIAFKLPMEETGCGSIGDRVFYDKNKNGQREFMEMGIPTVNVSLYLDSNSNQTYEPAVDTFIDSVKTNRLGFYLFQNLDFGTYFVDIDHPYMTDSAVVLTTQNDPAGPIELTSCEPMLDVDFGFVLDGMPSFLPVHVDTFHVWNSNGAANISWSTVSNTENLGFEIYRSKFANRDFEIINPEIIPISNEAGEIHRYTFADHDVEPGETYYYQLGDVDFTGNTNMYGPVSVTIPAASAISENPTGSQSVTDYGLHGAYPNPFNGVTQIQFAMKKAGQVKIEIFNLLGQKIRTLLAENRDKGTHLIAWDAKDDLNQPVGSGMYLIKMTVANFKATQQLLYLK